MVGEVVGGFGKPVEATRVGVEKPAEATEVGLEKLEKPEEGLLNGEAVTVVVTVTAVQDE